MGYLRALCILWLILAVGGILVTGAPPAWGESGEEAGMGQGWVRKGCRTAEGEETITQQLPAR